MTLAAVWRSYRYVSFRACGRLLKFFGPWCTTVGSAGAVGSYTLCRLSANLQGTGGRYQLQEQHVKRLADELDKTVRQCTVCIVRSWHAVYFSSGGRGRVFGLSILCSANHFLQCLLGPFRITHHLGILVRRPHMNFRTAVLRKSLSHMASSTSDPSGQKNW